ncbi:cell division protein FtsQ/DivIB [Parendozoicomonas sp. Alg238-R29]|uniref:cell division protein FtsQ/DivIB n=1 Tax=Parendozoicomonas sp. Alg238-R29 TaxID=2993446 RepID=UPI00248D863D|nr:cell division protein FtsQ/DivIB [Parendozoicomonas sp. Alg238-R29]
MDARRYLRHSNRDELRKSLRADKNAAPKKQNSRREQEERKQRFLLWGHRVAVALKFLVAGTVLGGLMLSLPVLREWLDRPVAKVEVSGNFRYLNQDTLQEELEPYLRERFFSVDLRGIQQVLEDDSWIANVRVKKIWPDRVEVALEEEVPVARWQEKELISADGKVLRSRQGRSFSELPLLGAPEGREQEIMQQYMTLSQQLRLLGLRVEAVSLTPSGNWSFRVKGVAVQLGVDELIERMQRFTQLYYNRLQTRWAEVGSIDLRYRDGVAVAWIQKSAQGSGQKNSGG